MIPAGDKNNAPPPPHKKKQRASKENYITLINFSTIYFVMWMVYNDIGGIK